jgi:response regulator RpfG family c-di-GMP phosphodiesterase
MTAVLMVTGDDDLTLAMTAIGLGAYGYMVKPVRAGELLINVANALHRRRREAETRGRIARLQASEEQAAATLAGEKIPLEGRIAAVADAFDALTSDRVYRPAFPVGAAVAELEAGRGSHFDPALLDAMHATFDGIDAIRRQYRD